MKVLLYFGFILTFQKYILQLVSSHHFIMNIYIKVDFNCLMEAINDNKVYHQFNNNNNKLFFLHSLPYLFL